MSEGQSKLVEPSGLIRRVVSGAAGSLLRKMALLCIPFIGAIILSVAQPGFATISPDEPIRPILAVSDLNPAKVQLGERLFRDARLSHDNRMACTLCHQLDNGGDDGEVLSTGSNGLPLSFNTPTVFNAGLSFRFNWRGNFRTLQEQNEAVLYDHTLMNTNWEELLTKLRSDPRYVEDFSDTYGSVPDRATVLDALTTFQRSLSTPNSRFDRYLNGDRGAISVDEERGYELFKGNGCISCHQGVNVGGNLFQKFGIFSNPFAGQTLTQADLGRFAITGVESDRHVFRVPSLRNIAVTAPYFHDGRTGSLENAVEIMARSQLGRELERRDVDLIAKFLATLTGEYRGQILTRSERSMP